MDNFVYHTSPDAPDDSMLVDKVPDHLQNGGAAPIEDRRKSTQSRVETALTKQSQYPYINALCEGLRAEEKQLFLDTHVDQRSGLLKRSGIRLYKNMLESGAPVSLGFLDGDHFGAINTVLGKEFADAQIRVMGEEFANLVETLRQKGHDVYAINWGGEEFVVFGTLDRGMLSDALADASEKIQTRIREQISNDDKTKIAAYIFAKTYSALEDGVTRAETEIGGMTGGVSSFQYAKYSDEHARDSITYTDAILTRAKDTLGRGKIYSDQARIDESSNASERLREKNKLTTAQNKSFNTLGRSIAKRVAERFSEHTPRANQIRAKAKTNTLLSARLDEFFRTIPASLTNAELLAQEIGIGAGELRVAKLEIMQAEHDYGTYTGAATMKKLHACGSDFTQSGVIDIHEFKSINDTVGHTHGDTYLMWFYNDVILPSITESGLASDDIVVAQDRVTFPFKIKSQDKTVISKFEAILKKNYLHAREKMTHKIDPRNPTFLDTLRRTYIERNADEDIDTRRQKMNTISVTPYYA